jgi:hypothetical protein
MIQEISALTLFALAIIYGIFHLGRFILPLKKSKQDSCGSASCGCKKS